jgi:hypothetical protein
MCAGGHAMKILNSGLLQKLLPVIGQVFAAFFLFPAGKDKRIINQSYSRTALEDPDLESFTRMCRNLKSTSDLVVETLPLETPFLGISGFLPGGCLARAYKALKNGQKRTP